MDIKKLIELSTTFIKLPFIFLKEYTEFFGDDKNYKKFKKANKRFGKTIITFLKFLLIQPLSIILQSIILILKNIKGSLKPLTFNLSSKKLYNFGIWIVFIGTTILGFMAGIVKAIETNNLTYGIGVFILIHLCSLGYYHFNNKFSRLVF